MKALLFAGLVLSVCGCCQKNIQKNKEMLCSTVINEVSYFWGLDSVGSNGFRAATVSKILESKLDTISVTFLLSKLGKPNATRKSTSDVEYVYYYFNPYKIPREVGNSDVILYISFECKKNDVYVSKITKWFAE